MYESRVESALTQVADTFVDFTFRWEFLMRLTLRTLLAYLNDTLEPTQAREIGKKVNESDFAAGLVERIKEVVRKRRLLAPELEGPNVGL